MGREYIVLRMYRQQDKPQYDHVGEVEASTHHTARTKAQRKYDVEVGNLTGRTGLVVVPAGSFHVYGV